MAVSGISSRAHGYQPHIQCPCKQRQQECQHLASALQSDDCTGAQHASAALQKCQQDRQTPSGQPASTSTNSISIDCTALGKARQSGDFAGAQHVAAEL